MSTLSATPLFQALAALKEIDAMQTNAPLPFATWQRCMRASLALEAELAVARLKVEVQPGQPS